MIDAHSHYGKYPDGVNETSIYFRECYALGVDISILMPVPSPVINIEKDKANQIFLGYPDIISKIHSSQAEEFEYHTFIRDNRTRPVVFYKSIKIDGNLYRAPIEEDPYIIPNLMLLERFRDISNVKLALFLHPNFTNSLVFELARSTNVVAFKLHGTAGCYAPGDISENIIDALKRSDLPLIVHTDFDRNPPAYKQEFILGNMPVHWIRFAQEMDFKVYLTHGARLDQGSITTINGSERFLVGLGPDLRMAGQPHKLISQVRGVEDYLKWLVNNIGEDRLAFDIDYPWNIKERDLDWESLERLKHIIKDENQLDKVLDTNARRFFRI